MNRKLAIFTVFFSIMCFENSIRILDLMMGWQFPIPDERPTNLDFSSNYDVTFSPLFRSKFLIQKEKGPYALAQTLTVMMCMILNNTLWIRRKSFSPTWHTIHYFLASIFLVMYIPRHDLWPVMQSSKYGYTNMNIFIYQMVLGTMAGLTQISPFHCSPSHYGLPSRQRQALVRCQTFTYLPLGRLPPCDSSDFSDASTRLRRFERTYQEGLEDAGGLQRCKESSWVSGIRRCSDR